MVDHPTAALFHLRVAALSAALLLASCADRAVPPDAPTTQRVTIGDRQFTLELALDEPSRYRGLSDRPSVPADGGMLFVFPKARRLQFVMRDCLVPIDIIFLDSAGRIVSMHQMKVEPYGTPDGHLPRYSSGYPAQFAIELAGGTLMQLQLERGQRIELPLADLKAIAR